MNALAVIKLINTGMLVADQVLPLVQTAMENNTDVSMEDLVAASGVLGDDLKRLEESIARAEAEGR